MKTYVGPSGRTLNEIDIQLWLDLEANKSIAWNPKEIQFKGGFMSHIYLAARNDLSDKPDLLRRVARKLKTSVRLAMPPSERRQISLIGIPNAGTQFAQRISDLSLEDRDSDIIAFRTMLKDLKTTHGKKGFWIGPADNRRHRYVSIENVCSRAESMIEAFDRIAPEGYPVKDMQHFVFFDWELGGMRHLEDAGYKNVKAEYIARDVIKLLVDIGRWPQEYWDYIEPKLAEYRT
jgi:orotate phosphoribosyltransferase